MFRMMFGYMLGRSSSRPRGPYGANFWGTLTAVGLLILGLFAVYPIMMSILTGILIVIGLLVLFAVRVETPDTRHRDKIRPEMKDTHYGSKSPKAAEARRSYVGSHRTPQRPPKR